MTKQGVNNRGKLRWALYLMLIPGIIITAIYSYGPLVGLSIAFQRFDVTQGLFGSPWVGLDNFVYIFGLRDFSRALYNTLFIASFKIVFGLLASIVLAILLNEVRHLSYKRTMQTIVYLPHFISWVIMAGIFRDLLSPSEGLVNMALTALGFDSIFFLGDRTLFPWVMIITDIWKGVGFGTILYLAALTGVDPTLYEAANIDGANRWHRIWYIALPALVPIIVLNATLSLGSVLNAGFDQIVNMYSPTVYATGDIIDTLVFRIGMPAHGMPRYDIATAVGFFKSVVSAILVSAAYFIAHKFANYRIF
jgi:putative aldouronate transport system permease protein